ncbi:MAG TPA: hypothetical protein VGR45_06295 [Stellaceae bacterium]|nr:hypothetical protein [Stellaceae bacterium]
MAIRHYAAGELTRHVAAIISPHAPNTAILAAYARIQAAEKAGTVIIFRQNGGRATDYGTDWCQQTALAAPEEE